ncbi:MAG: DUF1028 domain-containing protein [Thermoprotei archaeon]|nr:MAG: DUF1028 domain-containing protein [Thermoprotei archaeon]RLF21557.1 MAG: DUF1028 domain-containing protein [Thermoprotei archaeon]
MTYSIIGFDRERDMLGIAVVSGSIAVGSRVPWARYGIGGVATQAYTNPALGPIILELLRKGLEPRKALEMALTLDKEKEYRQVAVMDWRGRSAFFCGRMIPKESGAYCTERAIAIANLVASEDLPELMCEVFERNIVKGICKALLEAIKEAHKAGGDIRGDRSAAVIIVGRTEYIPYYDKVVDLRVDYAKDPLRELENIFKKAEVM